VDAAREYDLKQSEIQKWIEMFMEYRRQGLRANPLLGERGPDDIAGQVLHGLHGAKITSMLSSISDLKNIVNIVLWRVNSMICMGSPLLRNIFNHVMRSSWPLVPNKNDFDPKS